MRSKRISINGIETNYIAYDNGTVFDEQSRTFVEPIYRKSKWPSIKVWFQREEHELILKDVIADAFIPDPYERSIVGYLSPDISNNSIYNLIRMEDPKLERDKKRAIKAAKRAELDAKKAAREKLRQEMEARRQARIQRQMDIERKRFERQRKWVEECERRRQEQVVRHNNKVDLLREMKLMRDLEYIRQTLYTEFEYHVIIDPEDAWKMSEREASIHEVCGLLAMGYRVSEASKITGVPAIYIHRILYFGTWAHIAQQYGIRSEVVDNTKWDNPEVRAELKSIINNNPDLTARELAQRFKVPNTYEFRTYVNNSRKLARDRLKKQKGEG